MKVTRTIQLGLFGLTMLGLANCGSDPIGGPANGTEISAGGDSYAQEFTSVAYQVVNDLREHPVPPIDEVKLNEAIKTTRIESKPELTLDGREVGAINHPDTKRIEVSRKHWDSITKEPPQKELLVLHEFLGIMGVDDSSYQVSSLMDRGKVCNRDPKIREAIESSLKRQCNRITKYELQFVEQIYVNNANLRVLQRKDLWGLTKLHTFILKDSGLEEIESDAFAEVPSLASFFVYQSQEIKSKPGMFKGLGKYTDYVGVCGPFRSVSSKILDGIGGQAKTISLNFGFGGLVGADIFSSLKGFEEGQFGALTEDLDADLPVTALKKSVFNKLYLSLKKNTKADRVFQEIIENSRIKTVIGVDIYGPEMVKQKLEGVAGFTCGDQGGIMHYFGCTRS